MVTNGKPRYDVMRLTKRRIFARYGVFCGDGTMPVLRTWRFRHALRIRSLLESGYADGVYVGTGYQGTIEHLRREVELYDAAIASRDLEIERLRPALQVARQTLLEVGHAQAVGPGWYTRGKDGMYAQVRQWLQRGMDAIDQALEPPCKCPPDRPVTAGHAERCPRHLRANFTVRETAVREFLGWLSGKLPELHAVEMHRLADAWDEYKGIVESAARDGAFL